ncbi:MAG: hypothetical protein WCF33_14360 [Pseudonocardiaceae bacterium]
MVDPLPAWSTDRLSRLTGRPKHHLVEPALVGPLLGVDATGALRDRDGRHGVGVVIEQSDGRILEAPIASRWHEQDFQAEGTGCRV